MKSSVKKVISTIIMITILVCAYMFYKKNNFNNFIKAEYNLGISEFEKDSNVKIGENDSYKIINPEFNDAMFYQKIEVIPNTPYRVTCKIKTENVISKNENTDSGAHICIENSLEKSDNVRGTSDWTEVTFYFNSKNRTEVNVGFRLGGFEDACKRNSMVFGF